MAATIGLSINITKTKVMRLNITNSQPTNFEGGTMERVNWYIGSIIRINGRSIEDIRCSNNEDCSLFCSSRKYGDQPTSLE